MLKAVVSLCCLLTGSLLMGESIYLHQKDFDQGTYIIDKPGTYILAEDISFNPLHGRPPYEAVRLLPHQIKSQGGTYDDQPFGLGFFAAISVVTSDVEIDLNHHRIEQGKEYALLQRFFAVIELANQPFIFGEGPHNFGKHLTAASHVTIKNGTIGRSSHQGIHGNGNRSITIEDVVFEDFEVAAVSLNGVDGLEVKNCSAVSAKNVAVLGTFSAAQFILPYLDELVDTHSKTVLMIGGKEQLTPRQARDRIRQAVTAVHEDLILGGRDSIDKEKHPEEYAIFHNKEGLVDGNCYGFLVNHIGQAVLGFPIYHKIKPADLSKNIVFENVHVNHLKGRVNEVVAFNNNGNAIVDPVGAVFQVHNLHPDTKQPLTIETRSPHGMIYKGNFLANAQALVAKAYLNGDYKQSKLDLSRCNMTERVLKWVETGKEFPYGLPVDANSKKCDFICNSDSQFHTNKGVIGFKIDGAHKAFLHNTSVHHVANLGEIGSDICGRYKISNSSATLDGYGGAQARGYSIAGSTMVTIVNSRAMDVTALSSTATGFDIMTDSSNVVIERCGAHSIVAGEKFKANGGPNEIPRANGFRVATTTHNIALEGVCAKQLKGYSFSNIVFDESKRCRVRYMNPDELFPPNG